MMVVLGSEEEEGGENGLVMLVSMMGGWRWGWVSAGVVTPCVCLAIGIVLI